MNILIADASQEWRNELGHQLNKKGYQVFLTGNGHKVLEIFNSENLDLLVLDLNLSQINVYEILQNIRQQSQIPVLMIGENASDADAVKSLELGADDIIFKTSSMRECLARIEAITRRAKRTMVYTTEGRDKVIFGDLVLDQSSYRIYKKQQKLNLSQKEFGMLQILMQNPGKVYTKKQLYEEVWKVPYMKDQNTIMVHMSHIRHKIGDDARQPRILITVRGIGYKLQQPE
jgi:DNA-binding response OmpR family regulator